MQWKCFELSYLYNKLAALRAARFASVCKGSKSTRINLDPLGGSKFILDCCRIPETNPFYNSQQLLFEHICYRFLGESLLLTYSLQSYAHGLGQDGPGILENPQTNPGLHPEQCLFQQFCPEIKPWGRLALLPYSWLSLALDLAQMVLDVRKNLKPT